VNRAGPYARLWDRYRLSEELRLGSRVETTDGGRATGDRRDESVG
jgi:hypothetical protein